MNLSDSYASRASRAVRASFLVGVALTAGCGGGAAAQREDDFTTSGSAEADQRAEQIMVKDQQLKGGDEKEGTSLGNQIKKDELTGPQGVPLADEKKTLFDRLGGPTGIDAIVADFAARVVADPQVNLERKGVKRGGLSLRRGDSMAWQASGANLDNFRKFAAQFIGLKTGGPSVYEGPELRVVTEGMHFTNDQFDAAVGDLKQTLDKLQIPNQEQKELLAIIESTRTQIAEER